LIIVISAGGLCLTESFKPAAGLVHQTGLHLLVMGKDNSFASVFLTVFPRGHFQDNIFVF
jgi:hypothetical protein